MPIGGVIPDAGNSRQYHTGGWGKATPKIDYEKCKLCMLCWWFCPDGVFSINDGRVQINLDYCKACGICARECPPNFNAITMASKKEVT